MKLDQGLPAGVVDPARVANPEVSSFPIGLRSPYVLQWNFNIERQLPAGLLVQIGYVGSGARKLIFPYDVNRPDPGAGNVNTRRPLPQYASIWHFSSFVRSSYNALQARVEKRFVNGFSLLASYTYGHSLDNSGTQGDSGDPGPMSIRNLELEHASSTFDVRHRFVTSYVWELPFGQGRAWHPGGSVGGACWRMDGIRHHRRAGRAAFHGPTQP